MFLDFKYYDKYICPCCDRRIYHIHDLSYDVFVGNAQKDHHLIPRGIPTFKRTPLFDKKVTCNRNYRYLKTEIEYFIRNNGEDNIENIDVFYADDYVSLLDLIFDT